MLNMLCPRPVHFALSRCEVWLPLLTLTNLLWVRWKRGYKSRLESKFWGRQEVSEQEVAPVASAGAAHTAFGVTASQTSCASSPGQLWPATVRMAEWSKMLWSGFSLSERCGFNSHSWKHVLFKPLLYLASASRITSSVNYWCFSRCSFSSSDMLLWLSSALYQSPQWSCSPSPVFLFRDDSCVQVTEDTFKSHLWQHYTVLWGQQQLDL